MKILIVGENLNNYLAKCHEAFRTGLRNTFDGRLYGVGYPGYNGSIQSYEDIARYVFPEAQPNLLIAEMKIANGIMTFPYAGFSEYNGVKAVFLRDFWREALENADNYKASVENAGITYILTYFIGALMAFKEEPLYEKMVFVPPTFDPVIFNDWQQEKIYDVGFLAADTMAYSDFYPERYAIHQKIMAEKNLTYLYAQHPGWGMHEKEHELVGKNFSKKINSCKIFITTGGIYRNAQPKIFEALASHTLLLMDKPLGADMLGLRDGVNYVAVTQDTVIDKIYYYLKNDDERERISEAGYRLAMERHSCYQRAVQFYAAVKER
ncbi:MAG: glycosyltransferase [Desulfovibrionaceae bacterium]|nr:glycosyltransferase [Desulfovibrionaceae bacterium]